MYINTIRVLSCLQRGSEEIIYIISAYITVNSKETTNFPEGKKRFYAFVVLLSEELPVERISIESPGDRV